MDSCEVHVPVYAVVAIAYGAVQENPHGDLGVGVQQLLQVFVSVGPYAPGCGLEDAAGCPLRADHVDLLHVLQGYALPAYLAKLRFQATSCQRTSAPPADPRVRERCPCIPLRLSPLPLLSLLLFAPLRLPKPNRPPDIPSRSVPTCFPTLRVHPRPRHRPLPLQTPLLLRPSMFGVMIDSTKIT